MRKLIALLSLATLAAPAGATIVPWTQSTLWQEHYLWDALLTARSRAARQQADPNLLPVMRTLAQQAAQQAANLRQIQTYTRSQQDNLRFAFSQKDPANSLATIRGNVETLTKGTNQIKSNLYFLTARCRIASSQALPDPELTKAAALLISQIQAAQLNLNALYADAVAVQAQIAAQTWLRDNALRYDAEIFLRSVTQTQSAIFSVYSASYEIHIRSR